MGRRSWRLSGEIDSGTCPIVKGLWHHRPFIWGQQVLRFRLRRTRHSTGFISRVMLPHVTFPSSVLPFSQDLFFLGTIQSQVKANHIVRELCLIKVYFPLSPSSWICSFSKEFPRPEHQIFTPVGRMGERGLRDYLVHEHCLACVIASYIRSEFLSACKGSLGTILVALYSWRPGDTEDVRTLS
jgi:hypothetical protein